MDAKVVLVDGGHGRASWRQGPSLAGRGPSNEGPLVVKGASAQRPVARSVIADFGLNRICSEL